MNETIGIIPRAFRRRGVWVACTLLLRAGLNFLGLAMLLPVLALVLDPGSLEGGGVLTRAYEGLGFASQRTFALAVCAAVVGVIVLKCLLGLWLARVERTYIYDLYRTLSRRLLVTYHDRGLPFVKASNSAVLARNVNVVCLAFAAGVLKPAAAIAAEAMLLVLLFGALMWYTPLAALLALAVFLPSIWLYYGLVRNRINRYGELENKAQREKARLVAETFRGYADIEINNAFPMMLRQFDRAMDQVIRTRLRETAIGLLPQTFTEVGLAVGMALLVALSLGDGDGRAQMLFGVFAVAALRLMPSVRNIMTGWTAIKYNRYTIGILRDAAADCPPAPATPNPGKAAARSTRDFADTAPACGKTPEASPVPGTSTNAPGQHNTPEQHTFPGRSDTAECRETPAPSATPGPHSTPATTVAAGNSGTPCNPGNPAADSIRTPEKLPFSREIAVRDLRFRFADGGRELFHGLSLTIRKGERIGIRGASGAGKTTLFNLLLGLYEPTGGEIVIDGTPLTAANRRTWQNRIGYVSQSLFIADGSFAANVALGIPAGEVDRERVMQALRTAQLGELVAGLAKGIDTHVGECGCRLSGGQRQRIGIARALYRQADVLFFDEATSALDSRTEEEINRSIAGLAARDAGLTLVVIAHRESSLEYCNRIITIGE
ncbi:ATP-binding cassette domain-containing protein [Alistipes onderdonkii]|uniref:ATP-binding cassette domain-containing protein n=1 Tax=Alistipes onderdonkii TaxID=328813 RepID=UPI0032C11794